MASGWWCERGKRSDEDALGVLNGLAGNIDTVATAAGALVAVG